MNCIVEGIISHAHTRPSSLHPLPVDDDASQERFAVPRASTVNNAGRLEYGFPEGRTFKTIKQHAFEAQKRAEAEAEADLVERPQGRRHLQHTVFAHREEQKVLDELSAARPSKMINVELWATSKENPLHPAASLFVDEARHEADLADHDGRAARMVSRNGPGGYDKDKRYATRHKYDQRRVEENEADAIRMTNMTENRAEYTNGYEETRKMMLELEVEYPHGVPAHVRRQMKQSGLSTLGDTTTMANLTAPFTRAGYSNY